MISWFGAVPAFLLAAGLLVVPGALVAMGWGRRGLGVLLLAPPLSLAAFALASVVAPLVGVRWSLVPLAGMTLVLTTPALVLRGVGRLPAAPRTSVVDDGSDARMEWVWVLGGWAVAAALGILTLRLGAGRPDAVSQSYDAVFHLNALRYIEETGSASPLDLQGMIHAGGFYPSLWHAFASLVMPAVSGSVPAAANLATLSQAVVVWPLGCVLLVRQLLGPRPELLGAAAVLSMGFVAFPWSVLS